MAIQRGWKEHRRAELKQSLIETVLQKYERLQRQTESLAYSFYSDSSQLYRKMQRKDRQEEQGEHLEHEDYQRQEQGLW